MMDIVITVGPSSWSESVLEGLFDLGVSFVRFPVGKESPEVHMEVYRLIRHIEQRRGSRIAVIGDLPGGKPRLGNRTPQPVYEDRLYAVSSEVDGVDAVDFYLSPSFSFSCLSLGSLVSVGDGENTFVVEDRVGTTVLGRFQRTGTLERRRAFIPKDRAASFASFTSSDMIVLRELHGVHFDWIALSFVDSASDVDEARLWLGRELGWDGKIIAKIESRAGVANLDNIAEAADAIMVARGDLALQVGFSDLWNSQKFVLDGASRLAKYCIAGTGFLESFAATAVPCRSEVMDVCAALWMGANAIMLSSETTIGRFPVETVRFLREIERYFYSV